MKKLLAVLLLSTACSVSATPLTPQVICATIAEGAMTVMRAHQNGMSLSELLEIVGKNDILVKMALIAYEQPRMRTPENQNRMVADFRDQFHVKCLRTLSED